MSRFNERASSTKTINRAGGEAFKQTPELELVSLLLTSFANDKSYESAGDQLTRLKYLVKLNDPLFAAKAAIYARNEFGMRSITHALIGELAKNVKGQGWMKIAIEKAVRRPDDMSEILAYYISNYGKRPIPNSLKKGLSLAFNKFDAYQLGKYRGENLDVKLIDLVNLVHPKAVASNSKAIEKLVEGTLRSKNTWESKISAAGQEAAKIEDETEREEKLAELKAEGWAQLIISKKLGYFALLRNLRNIIKDAPEALEAALTMLTDPAMIKSSLVLPFRFLSALGEVEQIQGISSMDARKTIQALNKAIDISTANVPKYDGNTLVALDVSGSMVGRTADIARLFAAILIKSNNADLIEFDDSALYKNVNTADSTLTIARQIGGSRGGTDFHSIFQTADKKYERIFILSDMQGWVGHDAPTGSLSTYCVRTGAEPRIYSFDLAGHGDMQFPQRNVYCMAGFSDKIFDLMKLLEQDRNALITKIKAIDLSTPTPTRHRPVQTVKMGKPKAKKVMKTVKPKVKAKKNVAKRR